MAANSKHPMDIYMWVKKVIQSCETTNQLTSAYKLVSLYQKKFPHKYFSNRELRNDCDNKYYNIKNGKEDN